jgi:hypothetical protein
MIFFNTTFVDQEFHGYRKEAKATTVGHIALSTLQKLLSRYLFPFE